MTRIRRLTMRALACCIALAPVGGQAVAGDVPEVATVTFAAPREWRIRPHQIALGDSACSPYFNRLRWRRWNHRVAVGVGRGRFPEFPTSPDDSCGAAYDRAHPKRTRIRLTRPRRCGGHLVFTRIAWRAHGNRAHYTANCT